MKRTKRMMLSLLAGLMALTVLTACQEGPYIPDEEEDEDDSPKVTTTTTADDGENPAPETNPGSEETPKTEENKPPKTEGGDNPDPGETPEEHTHTANSGWQVDCESHWMLCDCGEAFNEGDHTLEDDSCTVCRAEVMEWDNGDVSVFQYDEYGNTLLNVDYDADGNLTYKEAYEYTYTEDGQILTSLNRVYEDGVTLTQSSKAVYTYTDEGVCIGNKQYVDDKLVYEGKFAIDADGWEYIFEETVYNEDGTKLVREYDENGDTISETLYDASGNPADFSDRFDPEACKDFVGTWKAELDLLEMMAGEMEGEGVQLPDDFAYSCNAVMSLIFRNDGTYSAILSVDPEEYKTMLIELTVEIMYISFEEEGMTRDEADVAFKAMMDMTIREYVVLSLEEGGDELLDSLNETANGVYYVQDDMIYLGENWSQQMEGGKYAFENGALTLTEPEMEMEITFRRIGD